MRRAEVSVSTVISAPPQRVYAALVDWQRQGQWIPFTKVRVTSGDGGVGSHVEAITAWGPLRLVDLMRVTATEPPYRLEVMHYGKTLRGPGTFVCTELPDGRTRLDWREDLELPRIPGATLAWPVIRPVVRATLGYTLRRLAADLST